MLKTCIYMHSEDTHTYCYVLNSSQVLTKSLQQPYEVDIFYFIDT